jgi:hypothetical protein
MIFKAAEILDAALEVAFCMCVVCIYDLWAPVGRAGTQAYADLERLIMKQVRATNQSRFRIGFLTSILVVLWGVNVFGKQIR